MQIFIPTYGRHDQQHTYKHLPKALQKRTTLVVQERESHLYDPLFNRLILPTRIQTISPTRQYIMEYAKKRRLDKIVMLDDDLRFDVRRKDDPGKFRVSEDKDIEKLFATIEARLDKYVHVGVISREGGNRQHKDVTCSRMMRVLAYDVNTFHNEGIKFDRLPLQEDFDVTLQLLRKGHPNLVLCGWVNGQGSSGAKGGCSHFRTIELHNENAKQLAELHQPFVKLVEKQTKGAWGGQARLDVTVQWKKAFASVGHANTRAV